VQLEFELSNQMDREDGSQKPVERLARRIDPSHGRMKIIPIFIDNRRSLALRMINP
jgi:hypothetical protein